MDELASGTTASDVQVRGTIKYASNQRPPFGMSACPGTVDCGRHANRPDLCDRRVFPSSSWTHN